MRFGYFIAFVSIAVPYSASACRIDIPTRSVPNGERIAGFSLAVSHAAITAMSDIPVDWIMSLTNEGRWMAAMTGNAIHGTAFLSDLGPLTGLAITPEPGQGCDALDRAHAVTLTLKLYKADRFRHYRVPSATIRLVE